jgi:hypothetical protein
MEKIIQSLMLCVTYFFVPLLIMNGLFYLVMSFVTMSFDPTTWSLFDTEIGRMFFVVLQFVFLRLRNIFWEVFK